MKGIRFCGALCRKACDCGTFCNAPQRYSYAGRTCYENLPRLSRQNGQAENNHRHNRTNGKTTTANMINDILADNGYSPVNNRAAVTFSAVWQQP